MATPAVSPDPFVRAHQDAQKAVATFLPSMVGRNDQAAPPPPPPSPMAQMPDAVSEGTRAIALANRVEKMAGRMARGLPPEPPPPTPEQQFGNSLDSVHTRAIQEAIASVPEEDRAKYISEAHDSAVKWIGAHNGKVIVHGKVELAHTPESAERLAAKIVNNEVEGHDQRRADAASAEGALRDARGTSGRHGSADEGRTVAGAGSGPPASVVPENSPEQRGAISQPAAQPEVVPPGDGEPPAQGTPPAVTDTEAAKVGSRKSDGHQITQPKTTIAANQKLALDAAPELHQALSVLTQQVPGTKFDRIRPQKATDRLDQKVEDDNDPDTLSDYLGAQIAADSPQAKDAIVDALKKNFNVIEVDDKFLTGRKDKAQYPSANVQVQLSNGVTAEVQIVPREVQDATEQSHAFYKAGREAEERGDNEERDRQWEKAAAINQGELAKFKARNGIGSSDSQLAGYRIIGKPIKVGSHTFLRVEGAGDGTSQAVETQDASGGNELVAREAPGTAPGPRGNQQDRENDATRTVRKGDAVRLKDGTPITVAYVDPSGRFIRAHTSDGRLLRQVSVKEIVNGAP